MSDLSTQRTTLSLRATHGFREYLLSTCLPKAFLSSQVEATEAQLNFFGPPSPIGMLMSSGWSKQRDSHCPLQKPYPYGVGGKEVRGTGGKVLAARKPLTKWRYDGALLIR